MSLENPIPFRISFHLPFQCCVRISVSKSPPCHQHGNVCHTVIVHCAQLLSLIDMLMLMKIMLMLMVLIYLVVMSAGAQRAMAASALKQLLISRCWKISLLVATASGWTSSGQHTTQVCDARHKHASTLQTNAHASWNPRNNTYVECCLLFMPTIHSGVARIIR